MPANEPIMHEVIMQRLDRVHNGVKFTKDAFAESVNDWGGIPVVYAKTHPEPDAFTANPDAELARVNGRIVSNVGNPRIEDAGNPMLMGGFSTDDADVNKLIGEGRASVSTGIKALWDKDRATTKVFPNHLLIFEEDAYNKPVDMGAAVLNNTGTDEPESNFYGDSECCGGDCGKNHIHGDKTLENTDIEHEETTMADTEAKLVADLALSQKENSDNVAAIALMQKESDTDKADIKTKDESIALLQKDVDAKDEQIKAFLQKEGDALKIKRDAQWTEIKAGIPVGLTQKDEDEKALRTEWEEDPHAFGVKLMTLAQKQPNRGKQGEQYTPDGDEEAASNDFVSRINGIGD
ncbi:MAG: hypothetical protein KAJ03_01800 [Gammaproteobacteria bacterium]|nr:hypothetical protein [Gammaproteobacteria bacterium]